MLRSTRFAVLLRRWFAILTATLLWTLVAVAQHPAVATSLLLDPPPTSIIGFDPAGNTYLSGTKLRKIAPDGTVLATYPLLQSGQLSFDGAGNLYVLDPVCSGVCPAPTTTFGTGPSGVLFGKVNSTGDAFVWFDEIANADGSTMQVDATGNVYLIGQANCSFAATSGAYQTQCASSGTSPAYAAKIDSTGSRMVYGTFLRGTTNNLVFIRAAAVDAAGNIYISGEATSDWPTTPGAFETSNGLSGSIFVAKLSTDGSKLLYSTLLNEVEVANSIQVDSQGSAYVAGRTTNQAFPTTLGAVEPTFPIWTPSIGFPDPAFVLKLKPDGGGLVYSTYVSLLDATTYGGGAPSMTLDSSGNAYVFGTTKRAGMPTVNAIQADDYSPGSSQGSVAVLNPLGSAYMFSTYLGGAEGALIGFVYLAGDGLIHVGGSAVANDFPALASTAQYGRSSAPFLMTLRPNGTAPVAIMFSTTNYSTAPVGALQGALAPACTASSCTQGGISINTTSQGTVYLGNYGAAPLGFGSLTASGDFTQTNNCPASVDAGARCVITVTFRPTGLGPRTGQLTLTASGLTQNFALFGTGYTSQVQTSQSSLQFGVQAVGTTSGAQTVTITDSGNSDLVFSGITVQGDFGQTNTCGGAIRQNTTCAVSVTFTPTASGPRNGTLTLASNALGSPTTIQLSGGVNPDFSVGPPAGGTTSQTINAGQSATYNLSLTPVAGFSGSVTLSCSGAPQNASCAVNPASVSLSGTAATPFTVSVNTAARSATSPTLGAGVLPLGRSWAGWWMWLAAAGSVWLMPKRRRVLAVLGPLAVLAIVVLLGMIGCGGGSSSTPTPVQRGTPAGTYTIVVSAASGSTTHTQNLTLTVN